MFLIFLMYYLIFFLQFKNKVERPTIKMILMNEEAKIYIFIIYKNLILLLNYSHFYK